MICIKFDQKIKKTKFGLLRFVGFLKPRFFSKPFSSPAYVCRYRSTVLQYDVKRWNCECDSEARASLVTWPTDLVDTDSTHVKMASCFLAVPLKRTWEVDVIKPLKTFISDTYSGSGSEDFDQALNEFNKLRNTTISKSLDKHESALEVLYRYSCCTIDLHWILLLLFIITKERV